MIPHFHVASWSGKRGRWDDEDFYRVGRDDWQDFSARWRRYAPSLSGSIIEIGSGTGRITAALAASFDSVLGVDVAPAMLEKARAVCPANVELSLVDGLHLPAPDDAFDAAFTCHVLQHLDSFAAVVAYLREIHRVLVPGGTAMVHLLLGAQPGRVRRLGEEAMLRWVRRAGDSGRTGRYRTRVYDATRVRGALRDVGFERVELCEFEMRSNGDPHACWLASKADSTSARVASQP